MTRDFAQLQEDPALTRPFSEIVDDMIRANDAKAREQPASHAPKVQPHSILKKRCKQALLDWHKARGFPACGIPIQNLPVEIKDRKTGKTRKYQTGRVGAGDLIWLCQGVAFALELKMPWDEQRGTQERFQEKWEASGGVYLIVRSPEQMIAGVEAALKGRVL